MDNNYEYDNQGGFYTGNRRENDVFEEYRREANGCGDNRYYGYGEEPERKSGRKGRRALRITAVLMAAVLLAGAFGFALWRVTDTIGDLQRQVDVLQGSGRAGGFSEAPQSGPQIASGEYTGTAKSAVLVDVSDIVDAALPSVVAITNTAIVTQQIYDPFSFFWGGGSGSEQKRESVGSGSGIIIGDNGSELWMVTNFHVIDGADTLEVTFCDGEKVQVYLKGTSRENDLAVVGVELSALKASTKAAIAAIKLGSSDELRLGEGVVAIGNALGWGQSVTTGCVSAKDREVSFSDGTTMNLLQTSAAINPGNSGGALLNLRGELIGINNAKYSDTNVEGVGFAIPISSVREIISELSLMEAKVPVSEEDFPYIGVTFRTGSGNLNRTYGMPDGALVNSVGEDTPASKAGVLPYDIITHINGVAVTGYDDLMQELQFYKGGTQIELTIMRVERGSYQEETIVLTLGFKKDYQ